MKTSFSSVFLQLAGIWLCVTGLGSMWTQAQSETEGSSSLVAENIRNRGYQSFGLGLGFIGFSLAIPSPRKNEDESENGK